MNYLVGVIRELPLLSCEQSSFNFKLTKNSKAVKKD
jgi:hypothetical protein